MLKAAWENHILQVLVKVVTTPQGVKGAWSSDVPQYVFETIARSQPLKAT